MQSTRCVQFVVKLFSFYFIFISRAWLWWRCVRVLHETTYFIDIVGIYVWVNESVDAVEEADQLHRFTLGSDVDEVGNVAEIYRRALLAFSTQQRRRQLSSLLDVSFDTESDSFVYFKTSECISLLTINDLHEMLNHLVRVEILDLHLRWAAARNMEWFGRPVHKCTLHKNYITHPAFCCITTLSLCRLRGSRSSLSALYEFKKSIINNRWKFRLINHVATVTTSRGHVNWSVLTVCAASTWHTCGLVSAHGAAWHTYLRASTYLILFSLHRLASSQLLCNRSRQHFSK